MTKYALIGALAGFGIEAFVDIKANSMGKNVHETLLGKVMSAPINLFFDITPVGKVFQRFSEDLHVFDGEVFHGFRRIFGCVTYLFFLFSMLLRFSGWLVVFTVLFICMSYYVVKPFICVDNQLHRIGHAMHSPMSSYEDQALRGNSVIRAFDQVDGYQEYRKNFVDKTTINFITHHSCWVWFNLRMYYLS